MTSIIVRGNFAEGHTFIGPFDSHNAAAEWADRHWSNLQPDWIATLEEPGEIVCPTCGSPDYRNMYCCSACEDHNQPDAAELLSDSELAEGLRLVLNGEIQ